MSHHLSGPNLRSPAGDARLDLTDDVLDARLAMLTNGKVLGDHIGPHTDLLPDFPYLGNPHGRTS